MKSIYTWKFAAVIILAFLVANLVTAQSKLVLNGAKINLANGANLVIANPASDAIIRNGGHIISEGENNQVKWVTGSSAATYTVPFGKNNADYMPLRFTTSAGVGSGYYLFATYGTTWQNSAQLPVGVTNLIGPTTDNSAMVIDRFWKIAAVDYTTKPALTNLSFTYLPSELAAPNTIAETMLAAQRWNDQNQTWAGFAPTGEAETTQKTVSLASVPANQAFTWWTLVDRSSPLPLELISFEAHKSGRNVNLNWVTAQEINCQNFEIQRSADAENFTTIAKENSANGALNHYQFTDTNPLNGTSYYRLKQNDLDGTFTYTPIRTVLLEGNYKITAYPNPTEDQKIQLFMGNAPLGAYHISVSDLKGSQVLTTTRKIEQPVYTIDLPANIKPGVYVVTLQNESVTTQFKLAVK